MEHFENTRNEKFRSVINQVFYNRSSEIQFCRDIISLETDDNFDVYMNKNSNIAGLFDLCVQYLDKDIHDKSEIWGYIEEKISSL
jgi:hypothetical protein